MYNWEQSAKANRKKPKKTGTVVLHKNDSVDLSFDRLLKPVAVLNELLDREEVAKDPANAPRAPLMRESTVASLQSMGFTALLPSQAQCYRGIFNRRDTILHSRTGSGKTLAYALPIIERHFILKDMQVQARQASSVNETTSGPAPFMLIFVSTMELAVQTRTVLSTVYPSAAVRVAGMDEVVAGTAVDVLVGTVRAIDELIRGKRIAAAATAAEEREVAEQQRAGDAVGKKRARAGTDGEEPASDEEDDDDDEDDVASMVSTATAAAVGVVSAVNVSAVVVDEVDVTLGPRFSNLGRRMKNLLSTVRRANGSLSANLMTDFRAHHYVLCGATIPNWVIKAGFLGVKKYYYQLVTVGTEKLPSQLQCMRLRCPQQDRVDVATRLLTGELAAPGLTLGRVIVFGSLKAVQNLAEALAKRDSNTTPAKRTKKGASAGSLTSSTTPAAGEARVIRLLTPAVSEAERITAMEDFNSQRASALLCTDLATRGLDFVNVDSVLMLSVPSGTMGVESFVHRAGRTARVGRAGSCLVLYDSKSKADVEALDAITKAAHVRLQEVDVAGGVVASATEPTQKKKSTSETMKRVQLTVRNPFKYKAAALGAVTPPSALVVLKKNMDADLLKELIDVEENADSNGEIVSFAVPSLVVLQRVKESLRKYSVKEL